MRSALALCNGGTLSVVAEDGWPLGLHVDFALDEGVRPIMRGKGSLRCAPAEAQTLGRLQL